jgi:hypothetical protein
MNALPSYGWSPKQIPKTAPTAAETVVVRHTLTVRTRHVILLEHVFQEDTPALKAVLGLVCRWALGADSSSPTNQCKEVWRK